MMDIVSDQDQKKTSSSSSSSNPQQHPFSVPEKDMKIPASKRITL
jgi:hypothetical protein